MNELLKLFQEYATRYLLHQYQISCDKVFWLKFKSPCQYPILHFDYSENIKFTPKHEAQCAHFSGQQHTLHCCVLQDNFVRIQQNVFTIFLMIQPTYNDLHRFGEYLNKLSSNLPSGHVVISSDNCGTQYKSHSTFGQMSKLASKKKVQFTWFCGKPNHSRELADAMSTL